ncbi:ABC transporter ATP-binding protein [Acuticoccus sp. M5D2P5]|uniref:zinc ABC transporter ATP-binding protein AztA n=1 Tax=Acuticoccus kalidii TaxID=2910977 RepID=UPI001F3D99D2|nr:zinc ABC transporter ATP-binding protein AztA [Acuticoccus kalidii]MCF3935502.1 ABC transporter ATP-binding protein [Acuticoccus kalidii]
MNAALTLDNVTLGYDRHPAIHHLSAAIAKGSLTAVVGPNGAGKSTLFKGIVGELRPTTGRIVGPAAREDIAYLPQMSEIDRSFPLDVENVVAMGLWRRIGAYKRVTRDHRRAIRDAIGAVGLAGFEGRSIGALSGGQMQRVLFARLLLQDAPLILLDEPFAAIDRRTVDDLLGLIRRWHQEGRTILAVLHDYEEVRRVFPETMLLARELIAHGPTETVMCAENLVRARAVGEAFDESAGICRRAA